MNNNDENAALRLKAVIDTAIDGIITIDEMGIVETMNEAAANLFGYALREVIGKNINMLMPQPYKDEHDTYIKNYKSTGVKKIIGIGREVKGQKKDGTIFPLRLAVSEVNFVDGKRIFTGIIHDLTNVKAAEKQILGLAKKLEERNEALEDKVQERTEKLASVVEKLLDINEQLESEILEKKITEKKLLKSQKELEVSLEKEKELNALKTRFVSMASHEFRTPLSTILSSVELVEAYQNINQEPKRVRHINRIKNAVNNLTDILKDFLSLSRLEEGKIEAQPEWFTFQVFCESVIEEMTTLLKTGQILNHEDNVGSKEIFMDKKLLKNILFNLISNAIKYSNENQTISCMTSIVGDHLEIVIQDEGKGIPEEDQPHLFTRFFRAKNVENIKGTGLGLNIVKRYLELMDGNITFKSTQGEGTTFYVTIPLNQTS